MENKRIQSPVKLERSQDEENNMNIGNFRNTNSVKKTLNKDLKGFSSGEKDESTPLKWVNKKLSYGVLNSWQKSPTKAQSSKKLIITDLPYELHFLILSFLQPLEIVRNIRSVCLEFNDIVKDKRLWSFLSKNKPLNVNEKYIKLQCVVERRSKGRLFKAVSWLDGEKVMIRKVNVVVSNAGQDDGIPTSILREISYLSFLQHENIQKIKEMEVDGEVVSIVAEQCDHNLKDFMKNQVKNLPLKELDFINGQIGEKKNTQAYQIELPVLKKIAFQILNGLNFLHHRGVMHRNLKPDNILINNNLCVKIGDFALSKYSQIPHINYTPEDPKDRERSGREARRLWYRSPDILLRKQFYSYELDMWAFGCIFAELAINEPLFNGQSEIEQLFKIFRMIGSPDKETFKTVSDNEYNFTFPLWETVKISHVGYMKLGEEYRALEQKMSSHRESSFKKLKQISSVIKKDGMDLLEQILQFDPAKRITAEQALRHPFFSEFTNVSMCQNPGLNYSNIPDCHIISYLQGMKEREISLSYDPYYLTTQPYITEQMRCILIDWLIDVSIHFEVWDETLHLAISYIDRVLSQLKVEKRKLQLIGVTCMKIAEYTLIFIILSVFNERSKEYYKQDNANEYAYITADEYTPKELIETEKQLLDLLDYKLNSASTMHYLKVYLKQLKIEDQAVTLLSMFLADMLLLMSESLQHSYSVLASAVLFMSCTYHEYVIQDASRFEAIKLMFTKEQFKKCLNYTKNAWQSFSMSATYINYETVYNKYLHSYEFNARNLQVPFFTQQIIDTWVYQE